MGQLRTEKVQEFIQQEISKIILKELKDPRIGFITVTRVEVTGDLRYAKIFISLMGNEDQKTATMQGLNHALGFLRTEIGKRIRLRFAPELSFHVDDTLEHSARIQELLYKIKQEEADK